MGRYQTSITLTYHRFTDAHATSREQAVRKALEEMFPDSQVRVTTYTEKPFRSAA